MDAVKAAEIRATWEQSYQRAVSERSEAGKCPPERLAEVRPIPEGLWYSLEFSSPEYGEGVWHYKQRYDDIGEANSYVDLFNGQGDSYRIFSSEGDLVREELA